MSPLEKTLSQRHSSKRLKEWIHTRACNTKTVGFSSETGTAKDNQDMGYIFSLAVFSVLFWQHVNEKGKKKKITTPCSFWFSSQKTKKICQEVWELLVEEHSAEGGNEEKSVPDNRHRVEMPEPSTGRTRGQSKEVKQTEGKRVII